MEREVEYKYPWDAISTDVLMLPSENLVYYLYKYRMDAKAKKTATIREDIANIWQYAKVLGQTKEENYVQESVKRK